MTRPRKTQLLALLALLITGSILAYVALGGIEKNLVYYLTPAELLARGAAAQGATVRLGGLVQRGSVHYDRAALRLDFNVGMLAEGGPSVAVHASGAPPQMFQEGIGAVVEGAYDGQTFTAERVMVKHSNEYRPPAPGERPQDLYTLPTDR